MVSALATGSELDGLVSMSARNFSWTNTGSLRITPIISKPANFRRLLLIRLVVFSAQQSLLSYGADPSFSGLGCFLSAG